MQPTSAGWRVSAVSATRSDPHSQIAPWRKAGEVLLAVLTLAVALSGSIVAIPIQLALTAVGIVLLRTDGHWDLHDRYRKVCACIYVLAIIAAIVLQLVLNPWGNVEQTRWDDSGWYTTD